MCHRSENVRRRPDRNRHRNVDPACMVARSVTEPQMSSMATMESVTETHMSSMATVGSVTEKKIPPREDGKVSPKQGSRGAAKGEASSKRRCRSVNNEKCCQNKGLKARDASISRWWMIHRGAAGLNRGQRFRCERVSIAANEYRHIYVRKSGRRESDSR